MFNYVHTLESSIYLSDKIGIYYAIVKLLLEYTLVKCISSTFV